MLAATTRRVPSPRIPKIAGKVSNRNGTGALGIAENRGSLPKRPGNVNHWGREGEKYQPGMNSNTKNGGNQQQPDVSQGTHVCMRTLIVLKIVLTDKYNNLTKIHMF